MANNEQTRQLVPQAEVDDIARKVLTWANQFPEKPVAVILYEHILIDPATGDETAMKLMTIPGSFISKRYILGGHKAEYNFQIVYRIKPGNSNDRRLKAVAMLNRFGDWALENRPSLGDGVNAIKVEPTTQAALLQPYNDGYEDYLITLKLTYEVI